MHYVMYVIEIHNRQYLRKS